MSLLGLEGDERLAATWGRSRLAHRHAAAAAFGQWPQVPRGHAGPEAQEGACGAQSN